MPETPLPPALRFMLAARRSELEGLNNLASTCQQVTDISRLVHALQRERGFSNLFLGSHTPAHEAQLKQLSDEAAAIEGAVLASMQTMDLQEASASDRARLFNRIAFALHCFEELPGLRLRIREQRTTPQDATAALTRLIGALLAVVFEAADSAIDPSITRVLVALFNFMQGKELAGQERATGVTGFAIGYFDAPLRTRLEHLAQSQERCFQSFLEFADDQARSIWLSVEQTPVTQLRAMALRTHESAKVDPGLSEVWFDLATQRIDRMHEVETRLARQLLEQCQSSIALAHADLDNHRALSRRLAGLDHGEQVRLFSVQTSPLDDATEPLGPHVARSLLDLLQAQTQRLQSANHELDSARQSLNERKVVERAKYLLMEQMGLSESEAHGRLRQGAMDRGERLIDVAQRLIDARNKPRR
ncbi:nitrate regulatory protein [Pseudomonas sp. dw_358]|uniref:nitrate regulatory protein n=1 Tax=Pseudomonas sp. dw_358 TaxID=2720083 RepID=UPI001BD566E1|nr:nitrate regulatory protein [Pseudomonas sp. dw_358]